MKTIEVIKKFKRTTKQTHPLTPTVVNKKGSL